MTVATKWTASHNTLMKSGPKFEKHWFSPLITSSFRGPYSFSCTPDFQPTSHWPTRDLPWSTLHFVWKTYSSTLIKFLWNTGTLPPNYMASLPTRQLSYTSSVYYESWHYICSALVVTYSTMYQQKLQLPWQNSCVCYQLQETDMVFFSFPVFYQYTVGIATNNIVRRV